MIGLGWLNPTSRSLSGSGSPAAGNRILVLNEVKGANPVGVPTREDGDRYAIAEAAIKEALGH